MCKRDFKADLVDKLNVSRHHNPTAKHGKDREKQFWSRISPKTAELVFEAYKMDFVMFDYDFNEYFMEKDLQRLAIRDIKKRSVLYNLLED